MAGFHEPQSEEEVAGQLRHERVASPYERFMEEEGIPSTGTASVPLMC